MVHESCLYATMNRIVLRVRTQHLGAYDSYKTGTTGEIFHRPTWCHMVNVSPRVLYGGLFGRTRIIPLQLVKVETFSDTGLDYTKVR